ncbi:hypothetical protein B0T20DRAFT_397553 [Sordaria brevicollis]|uniref:Uncharacterized protein n=1 Tax=Sordaria brevicollis TaxID=83679 RepID=A0AAE0NVR2_SORBR|nr:hypothetical protein B0T20DRAFT_397553 [Sordaria brevicollis]
MPLGYNNRAYTVVHIDVDEMRPNSQQSPPCPSSPPTGGFARGFASSPSLAAFARRYRSPPPAHIQRAYRPPTSQMASRSRTGYYHPSPDHNNSRSSVYRSRSPVYNSRSPAYGNSRSPAYHNSHSPAYNHPSPMYNAPSPVFNPTFPVYNPASPVFTPTSPVYRHPSPVFYPTSPAQASGSAYYPASPAYNHPASPAGPAPFSPLYVDDMRNQTPSPHRQQRAHMEQNARGSFYVKSPTFNPSQSPEYPYNSNGSPVFCPTSPSPDYAYNGQMSPDYYRPGNHGHTNTKCVQREEEVREQQRQQKTAMKHLSQMQEWHWTGAEDAMDDWEQGVEQNGRVSPAGYNPVSSPRWSVVSEEEVNHEQEAEKQHAQERAMKHLSQMQEWHWTGDGDEQAARDEHEEQHVAAFSDEEELYDRDDYEGDTRADDLPDYEYYEQQARADDLLDYEYYEELDRMDDAEATKQRQQEKAMEHLAKMEEWHWSDDSEEDVEKNEKVQQQHTVAISEEKKRQLYKSYDCFQQQNWTDDLPDYESYEGDDESYDGGDEMTDAEPKEQDNREKVMRRLSEMQKWHWNEDTHEDEGAAQNKQAQQQPNIVSETEDEDLADYEYYEELDRMSETEAEMEVDTHPSSSDANPYTAIAALNQQHPSGASQSPLSSPEPGQHAEFFPRLSLRVSSRATMSSTSTRTHPLPKRPIGNVGIRKSPRLDKAMWRDKMQRKVAGLVRLCERYVPKGVMEEFEREYVYFASSSFAPPIPRPIQPGRQEMRSSLTSEHNEVENESGSWYYPGWIARLSGCKPQRLERLVENRMNDENSGTSLKEGGPLVLYLLWPLGVPACEDLLLRNTQKTCGNRYYPSWYYPSWARPAASRDYWHVGSVVQRKVHIAEHSGIRPLRFPR